MSYNKLKSALIAGAVVLGTLASMNTSANARGGFGVEIGGPGFSVEFGDRGRGRGWDRGGWERPRRVCRPGRALRKARNRGIRRAYIARVGRRGVVVKGRKWGERVTMGFGRHRSCPVRFVRAR